MRVADDVGGAEHHDGAVAPLRVVVEVGDRLLLGPVDRVRRDPAERGDVELTPASAKEMPMLLVTGAGRCANAAANSTAPGTSPIR